MKYDEFIRVEQLDGSDLTSTVFMSDDPDDDDEVLAIHGIVYRRDLYREFNEKATSYDELDDVDEIVSHVEGSWIDSWIIDNKNYWTKKQNVMSPLNPVSNPLPSDSRYREDLIYIWRNNYIDYAQKWKMALEEIQRKDLALRKKHSK